MMKIKKQQTLRSKYKSINSSERALIIQYIEEYKYSTSHVSMITGHNISTIKAIYQVYKKEGRVQKKEKRDKILNVAIQVQLVIADDINQGLENLGDEIKEFKTVKEDDKQVREFKEQMIKEMILKKQSQILSLLSNQQAVKSFINEMNTFFQKKTITNEFSLINPDYSLKLLERQQIKFARNQNLEKCSNINQVPINVNQSLNSQILKILDEQHRLMKT